MRLVSERLTAITAVILSAAAFTFGIVVTRALSGPVLPVPADGPEESAPWSIMAAPVEHVPPPITVEELMLTADQDPFSPDRQRPEQRYSLRSEPPPQPVERVERRPEPAPPPDPPPFQVLGTITGAGGSGGVAVIRAGNASPRVVAVGDSIQDFTLASVQADGATVTGNGGQFALSLVEASPDPAPPQRDRRDMRDRRPTPPDRQDVRGRPPVQQIQELLQQLQGQRGRGRGGGG